MRDFFKPWRRKIGVVTLGLACLVMALYLIERHPARSALPSTATDIHLYCSPSLGITGDFYDLLKAKITEDEFVLFVKRLSKMTSMSQLPELLERHVCKLDGASRLTHTSVVGPSS